MIAWGDLRVVSLDRDSFVRLLGPIDHILKRNQQNYQQVERKIYDEQMDVSHCLYSRPCLYCIQLFHISISNS